MSADARTSASSSGEVTVLGITIADQSFDSALKQLSQTLSSGMRHTLFFVNAHTLNLASESPEYHAVLRKADVVFGDGTGIRWAARLRGKRLVANLNGTDIIPALLRQHRGVRCFILGSAPERIQQISDEFKRRFPSAVLVGAHHGYVDERTSLQVVQEIDRAKPDLLLVGMGNPLQEEWISRYRSILDVPLTVGVGGLFEYWSGMLDRAPSWMRRAGIEWLHILRRQPWKARRYLIGNFKFLWRSITYLKSDTQTVRAIQQW